jgi:hypothetical protein
MVMKFFTVVCRHKMAFLAHNLIETSMKMSKRPLNPQPEYAYLGSLGAFTVQIAALIPIHYWEFRCSRTHHTLQMLAKTP